MTKAEPKSPFYWLREVTQDALLLGLPTLMLRVIATTLARRADEDYFARTGELISWIGADKLATAMGCNRRTVQRGLNWLLDHGVIAKWEKGGGRGRSTRYCFSKQWLGKTAVELEKSGQAKAYGLPNDLFAFADGTTLTAVSAQFSGSQTANATSSGGDGGGNYGVRTANRGQNSGLGAQVSEKYGSEAAVNAEYCGQNFDGAANNAVSKAQNCGSGDVNCGPAMPPEIDLNKRNKGTGAVKTATGRNPDLRQGHFRLPLNGGRSAAAETKGYPGAERNRGWQPRTIQQAAEILGDPQRAILAVEWLEDGQKGKLADGYLPKPDELEKWLGWALDRAEDSDALPSPAPADVLPPDLAQAVQLAAQQAVRDVLPSIVPTLIQALQQQLQAGGAGAAAA